MGGSEGPTTFIVPSPCLRGARRVPRDHPEGLLDALAEAAGSKRISLSASCGPPSRPQNLKPSDDRRRGRSPGQLRVRSAVRRGRHTARVPQLRPAHDERGYLRNRVLKLDELRELPQPDTLVSGLLDLDSLAVLYGPPKAYKSFVALDWALSVATGSWWQGRRVEPCHVLYVAAEGVSGLWARVDAWMGHNRHYVPRPTGCGCCRRR